MAAIDAGVGYHAIFREAILSGFEVVAKQLIL